MGQGIGIFKNLLAKSSSENKSSRSPTKKKMTIAKNIKITPLSLFGIDLEIA